MDESDKTTDESSQWQPAPGQPWLRLDEVHVWRARLGPGAPMPVLRETLTLHEALAAERLPDVRERRQFIASRGLLRSVLAGYLDLAPAAVPFTHDRFGHLVLARPYDDLRFDVSEADGLALVAVSWRKLGLEIERVRENLPFTDIAGHYFEPEETWDVIVNRGAERATRFFDLWTKKEAIRRAGGEHVELNTVEADPEFMAALAVAGENSRLRCWDWQLAA